MNRFRRLVIAAAVGALAAAAPARAAPTIYDPALKVTWLADANLAATHKFNVKGINKDGSMPYKSALAWVSALNAYNHKQGWLGHHDWTLPITPTPYGDSNCSSYNGHGGGSFGYGCLMSPLARMYAVIFGLRAPATAVAIPDRRTGPFRDFQPYLYWSGKLSRKSSQGFLTLSFNTGWRGTNVPKHNMYALPIIDGNPFHARTVSHRKLYPVANRRAVFEPGAGARGVTWLADADFARRHSFGVSGIAKDGSMQQPTAASWVGQLNKHRLLSKRHWRLPRPQDLEALYHRGLRLRTGQPAVRTPNTTLKGVQDVQPYLYWSCGGKSVAGACGIGPAKGFEWSFSFGNGFLGTDLIRNSLYVMVYYPTPGPIG